MSLLVLLLVILCLVYAAWLWSKHNSKGPLEFPGALPIIGHTLKVIGDRKHLWNFMREFQHYALKAGDVVEFWFGTHSVYLTTDPEDNLTLCNLCLNKPFFYDFAKDHINNGLINAEATVWKSHRKILNPSFNQLVLNTYVEEINTQARSLVSQLALKAGKGPFDSRKYFINYTLSTVTRTSLGLNTEDQSTIDTDYAEAIEDLLASYCDRFQKVWLYIPLIFDWSAMKRKQTSLIKKLKKIIDPVIHKRKSELKAYKDPNYYDDSAPGKFKPILDRMLQLADEKNAFTDDDIRHHLDTFVAAAYDTTSSALTFNLLVLGSYQDVQDRIYKELQKVFGDDNHNITKQDLPKLVYLEAVIKESMRLYPAVPLFGRKLDRDIKLKNHTLKAGNTCLIGLYALLRHPMWGPDVNEFKPERWLDSTNLPDHPSLNATFGVGKRNCIGKLYGMMVMKTALAHILRRFHVSGNINNVVCEFGVILKPVEGHLIELTPRT